MITSENIQEVIKSLNIDQILEIKTANPDYVLLRLHIFNFGWFATIQPILYSDEIAEAAERLGNIIMDKYELLEIYNQISNN